MMAALLVRLLYFLKLPELNCMKPCIFWSCKHYTINTVLLLWKRYRSCCIFIFITYSTDRYCRIDISFLPMLPWTANGTQTRGSCGMGGGSSYLITWRPKWKARCWAMHSRSSSIQCGPGVREWRLGKMDVRPPPSCREDMTRVKLMGEQWPGQGWSIHSLS